ncbi:MAG: transposase [Bdellovibrionales bacterium]|nr:transposase [Bdellovibrionales bacterium]
MAEGIGVKSTCRLFRIGKNRVRSVRAKGIEFQYLNAEGTGFGAVKIPCAPENVFPDFIDKRNLKTSEADQILLAKKDWILDRLAARWSPITIFEELKNVEISRSTFYRFMARHSLESTSNSAVKVSGPIIHTPGEALICVDITMDAIESMLQEIGGVPRKVTSDNPKCFATKADKYDPVLNPSFERLANHYGFRIECLLPQDPKKKGKVERMVPYARRLFEAFNCEGFSLERAQKYIDTKCGIANERRHGTTDLRPVEVFRMAEVDHLIFLLNFLQVELQLFEVVV